MIFLTPGEPSGAMFMPAQQNVAKKLRKSNKTWRFGSNTNIGFINVESVERTGNANSMVSSSNRTAFYKISAASATTSNNFPENNAGCLMVMNLYATHMIQVFFSVGNGVYIRSIVSAPQAGSSWTAWKKIS